MASGRDEALSFINPHTSSPIAVSEADGSQIGSASGSFQNEVFLNNLENEAEFGFYRPDFRQSPLVGTVEFYDRHVFLCYKNPQVWPPRIEAAEFDRLPRLLAATLNARKGDMKRKTRLTICEGHDGTETSNGDVLIFPDMIRYRRLTHFDVDTFVEEVLVKDGDWLPGFPEPLRGWYIFVCCHGTRDRRCGACGPALVNRFRDEIEARGFKGRACVSPCSHIGGHKYAGNVIIFGKSITKVVTGHWYGYVTPEDVAILLEQHIGKGEIVDWLWRGQMGLSEEKQITSQEQRFQLNGGSRIERSLENLTQTNEASTTLCGSQAESAGCCQGNGSFPCCHNLSSPEKRENPDIDEETAKFAVQRKSTRKQLSRNNSGRSHLRKVCSMPSWFESWEREDTYAALAVISAIVSVAYAYNCYKKLR